MPENQTAQESFRDKVATVDKEGKRIWIYPKKPKGRLHNARIYVSIVLLALLFGGPFMKVNGQPILLLNILERKFILFGMGFWPQDFHLFVLGTISFVVFIVLFTVVFGRIWCGWACPQTIFMEMVFRKIEYFIEGDAHKQRKLNESPLSFEKFIKKFSKHSTFYGISFLIGNTFLAYIIGIDELFKIITDPPSEHLAGLSAMIAFSLVFYGVFSYFREQACIMVCPYGRLQSVLLDPNSIVVAYDFVRGEPRGKQKKVADKQQKGDCIDCHQCVDVCPTGIDIRNGTQLECVNCTACIDACDTIMDKVNKPRGLIRYASYKGIKEGIRLKLNPRIAGYSLVLIVLLTVLTVLLAKRAPLEVTVLRTPGVMYQETDDGKIVNLYNLKVLNKTFEEKDLQVSLAAPQGELEVVGGDLKLPAGGIAETAFFIRLPKDAIQFANTPVRIKLSSGDIFRQEIGSSFIGPQKKAGNQ